MKNGLIQIEDMSRQLLSDYIIIIMLNFSFFYSLRSNPSIVLRLKDPINCFNSTSSSAILSIGAFIVHNFPGFPPPTLAPDIYLDAKIEKQKDWQANYFPFQQPWSNYLINLTINHRALYYNHTFYIDIPITQMPERTLSNQHLIQINLKQDNLSIEQRLKQVFQLPKIQKSGKKIGIIAYRSIIHTPLQPRVNSVGLFLGNLFRNDEWKVFRIQDNQIPNVETLIDFDCIILPGSVYSVCNILPNHLGKTVQNIIQAYSLGSKLKIIGTCFGHQIIAKFFGAKVQKIKRAGGIQKIIFDANSISQHQFLTSLQKISQLYISKHHQDFVISVPEGFKPIATSNSCKYEGFISHDKRIFTVQFHSQYFCHFTKRYEVRRHQYCGKNQLQYFYVPFSQIIERLNVQHSKIFIQVFRKFID